MQVGWYRQAIAMHGSTVRKKKMDGGRDTHSKDTETQLTVPCEEKKTNRQGLHTPSGKPPRLSLDTAK